MVDKEYIKLLVRNSLIEKFIKYYGIYHVPVAISNRHIHICQNDLNILFGKGYILTPERYLSQPGQFACVEKLTLVGPKNKIDNVRILGPTRKDTQIEISVTDGYLLGIESVVRMSGDIVGTPGCKLIGPNGYLELNQGVIVSARHLHISKEESDLFGLNHGDIVKVKKTGLRSTVFEEVLVRCGKEHKLEMHIDTDEANSAAIVNGDILTLEKDKPLQEKQILVDKELIIRDHLGGIDYYGLK
jgi:putative phosphotransacetylase